MLEHCDVGRGDELVDMHRAEEPVLVFARSAEFLEICIESRHAHGLLVLEPEETFYLHRRLVGDYNINFVAELLEILRALGQLRFGGYLVARPGVEIRADIYIRALAAAHCKDAHAVEVVDLTAHEMIEVAGDMMDFSALEFRDLVAPESFEILVRAVDKAYIVFELAYLFEQLLFILRAVPDESEIAADEERIALFQFFERGRCESLVISVGVSRNIKHDFNPPDKQNPFYYFILQPETGIIN